MRAITAYRPTKPAYDFCVAIHTGQETLFEFLMRHGDDGWNLRAVDPFTLAYIFSRPRKKCWRSKLSAFILSVWRSMGL